MGGELDGLKILAAEDNRSSLGLAMTLVRLAGGSPTGVNNGKEAVDAVCSGQFDAVLMDVQMPVMDGLQATQAIRDREATSGTRRLPIIGVTAHALPEHARMCREAGMDAVVTKPVDPVRFAATVRSLLDSCWQPE
ncbi:MAG: response regulator [Coriobacteriia bacterium]